MLKSCIYFDPFYPSVAFHIETSDFIYSLNKMAGFCMECNTELKNGLTNFCEGILLSARTSVLIPFHKSILRKATGYIG